MAVAQWCVCRKNLLRDIGKVHSDPDHRNRSTQEIGILSLLKERYNVHWLTGQFHESNEESRYRSYIEKRVRLESRLALILASLVFGMFAISDYKLLGPTREYYLLITMRIVVVSLCLLLAFTIGRWGSYSRHIRLHALPLWIFATGIILIVPLRPDSLSTQITAAVVATIAFYLLIPNLLTVTVFASLYLSVGFLASAVFFAEILPATTLRIALLLIMANVVGYSSLLRLEVLQRKQFALLHEEREQNGHLLKEIARRESLEAQLRVVAERDDLTGLDSRSHFMKRANALLQRSRMEETTFCLFMIDVDHFKSINDTWGHTRGDWILTRIAMAFEQSLRPTDVIGRFGGEEFVVGLPNTSPNDAQIVAERLRGNVAALLLEDEMHELRVSVTVGIAVAHAEDADLDSIITRADKMLYSGKRNGRNRVVMHGE